MENNYFYTFKEWFKDQNGLYASINLPLRKIELIDDNDSVINEAYFSNEIPNTVSVEELIRTNHDKERSYTYFIVLNGYENKNWLYRRQQTITL